MVGSVRDMVKAEHDGQGSVVARIESPRLVDSALQAVRNSILEGRIAPGERLLEVRLASELGISRGPLREALHLLEKDGIIYSVPRRGKFVQSFDARAIDEVYSLRTVLETFAVQRFISRTGGDDSGRLEAALDSMRRAAAAEDIWLLSRQDIVFHQTLVELAEHELLTRAWLENVAGKLHILLNITAQTHRPMEDVLQRHEELLQGLRRGDQEFAAELIRRHLDDARERALRALSLSEPQ